MNSPEIPPSPNHDTPRPHNSPGTSLSTREYFAVHLYQAATANLSLNCSLQDKAKHAVDAADALIRALEENPG
ncbi:MAG: hypothetical protein AAGC68_13350 [Verrucomicrobiota bacterium]